MILKKGSVERIDFVLFQEEEDSIPTTFFASELSMKPVEKQVYSIPSQAIGKGGWFTAGMRSVLRVVPFRNRRVTALNTLANSMP